MVVSKDHIKVVCVLSAYRVKSNLVLNDFGDYVGVHLSSCAFPLVL